MKNAFLSTNKGLVVAYAVFAGGWILLSNQLLKVFVPDPSLRLVLASYNLWVFGGLNFLFLIFVLFKGAGQVQTMRAFEESEGKYREVVELANCIVLRWSPDGHISFINEYGQHFFGYAAGEIIGRHVMDTIVPAVEIGRDLQNLMEKICANPKAFEQSVNENIRRNGERVWIAWTNRIVFDGRGGLKEILSVGSDVTDRRRAEIALEASELKFRSLSENSPTGVYIVEEHRLRYANAALVKIFGYAHKELISMNTLELFEPKDRERVSQVMARRSAGDLEERGEYRAIRKDGRRIYVEIVGAGFLLNNRFADIGNVLDITERKISEMRIQYLNRIYAVLSGINEVSVHEKNLQEMFKTACRIAVEKGGFHMAWIGLADASQERLKPVASAGFVECYLDLVKFDLPDPAFLAGPTGTCYQTGQSVTCNDIEHDPRCERWREQALQHGYRSFGSFPLKVDGEVVGNINLYATELGSFNSEELSLLDELATDIGFASCMLAIFGKDRDSVQFWLIVGFERRFPIGARTVRHKPS